MENTEIWKNVVGYEDLYQVSNLGRVKSLNYLGHKKIQFLKLVKTRKGYFHVQLYKNGNIKSYQVHRLVAEAFIENPENLPQVNHKDEDKSNNFVGNLEWVSNRANANFGTRNKRISEKNTNGKRSKKVLQISLEGELLKEWPSTGEIQRKLGFSRGNVSSCCRGLLKTAYNFIWKYKNV